MGNGRSAIQRILDWIATGIKVLFGLGCLGAGFVGLAIAGGVLGASTGGPNILLNGREAHCLGTLGDSGDPLGVLGR